MNEPTNAHRLQLQALPEREEKYYRQEYHRKLRKRQKRQLKRFGDIIDATLSIGYTD